MDMNQFNLPVSMLRQYCFCPRIPYFYIARNITPVEKEWMSQGIEEHKRQEMLSKRRNLSRFGISTIGKFLLMWNCIVTNYLFMAYVMQFCLLIQN